MKKSILKTSLLGLSLAVMVIGSGSIPSRADGTTNTGDAGTQTAPMRHRHHRHGGFMLGVCVGQTLAQQGITLPAPTPGQRPSPNSLDTTTRQAIHAAVQTCRAQFHGTQPSPEPSSATTTPQ